MICFPDITSCDARNIPPDTLIPTLKVTPAPTISLAPLGPTPIPTDMPIEPPDPLPFPSDDPTDHWFWCVGYLISCMLFDIVLIYIMCVPFAALIVEWELMMQMQNVLFIARQLKNAPLARVSFLSSAVEILILAGE